jgi:hypothetical protein
MPVSDQDRDYMRRIGESKRRSHEDARLSHLALSLDERLRRSFELSRAAGMAGSARDDDPGPFYELARALGLYIS